MKKIEKRGTSLFRPRWAAAAQIALLVLGAGTIWLMREALHDG